MDIKNNMSDLPVVNVATYLKDMAKKQPYKRAVVYPATRDNLNRIAEWFSPPGMASNPSPGNGDTLLVRNPTLGWTPGNGSSSFDIFLGTSNPPSFLINSTLNSIQTEILSSNTTYYWRIDCKNQYTQLKAKCGDLQQETQLQIQTVMHFSLMEQMTCLIAATEARFRLQEIKLLSKRRINVNELKSQPFAGSVIVKDQGSNSSGYMIRCGGNGIINFNIGNGSWHEISTPENSVQLNRWHHVAAVYDGSAMKIFIDGDLKVYQLTLVTADKAHFTCRDISVLRASNAQVEKK